MLKKLFSHSMIYGIAPQIGKVAGIFALPIITKDLTEIDYGIWGIIVAYTGALQALFTLGMEVVLANSFFKMPSQHKWLWRQVYGFLYLVAIPFSILVGLLLYWVIPSEAQSNIILIIVLILAPRVLFGPTTILGLFYYQLRQNPIPVAIRSGVFGFLTVVLNVYTISYLKMGYMGWVWSLFIVTVLMNFSYWYPLVYKLNLSPIFNFKWRLIRKSFKVALPTIPHQYASFMLNTSDRIVMDGLNVSIGALGEYNLASTFGGYFQALIGAANQAVSPMMMECYKKNDDIQPRNMIFVLQIAMLVTTFLFCIWSKEIFEILINNDVLKKVYPLAIIIVMAYNYRPMFIGAMNKLFYVEKTELLWRVSFVAAALNIILNLIFIPIYGFETAAYTTFISLMYMGFSGHFIPKIKEIQTTKYYAEYWFLLIITLTGTAYYLVESSITFKLIITGLLFLLLILMYYKGRSLINSK